MTVTFHFNAAACGLAQHLYYARALAFDVVPTEWTALTSAERHGYVEEAADILRAKVLAPRESPLFTAFVGITRAHAAKVVGTIRPDIPWGEEIQS